MYCCGQTHGGKNTKGKKRSGRRGWKRVYYFTHGDGLEGEMMA